METIKIIDILVNIATGKEVPKKIIYQNREYVYDDKDDVMDYYLNEDSYLNSYNNDYYLFENELNHSGLCQGLNEEVEIIEDNEYILKHIEKDRPFKTEKECIEYYMDECWVKQDVASDLFYYKVIIDKAIEYIHNHQLVFELSSKEQIQKWFDEFYVELLNILRGEKND